VLLQPTEETIMGKFSIGILKPLRHFVAACVASFLAVPAPNASANVCHGSPSPTDLAQKRAALEARIIRVGRLMTENTGPGGYSDDQSVRTVQFPNWANYNVPNFPNFPNFRNSYSTAAPTFPNFANAFPNFPNFANAFHP
jgi:hypothetical protein